MKIEKCKVHNEYHPFQIPDNMKICSCGELVSKELQQEIDDHWRREGWKETFALFHDGDPNKGSASWKVSPNTIYNFILGLLEK